MKLIQVGKATFIDPSSIKAIQATSRLYLGEGEAYVVVVEYGKDGKSVEIGCDSWAEAEEYAVKLNNLLEESL